MGPNMSVASSSQARSVISRVALQGVSQGDPDFLHSRGIRVLADGGAHDFGAFRQGKLSPGMRPCPCSKEPPKRSNQREVPLTTRTIFPVGSYYKAFYRNYKGSLQKRWVGWSMEWYELAVEAFFQNLDSCSVSTSTPGSLDKLSFLLEVHAAPILEGNQV